MSFLVFSQIVNLFTGLCIGVLTLIKNHKNKVNQHLSFFCFSVAFWSFNYILWQLSDTQQQAYLFLRILMLGATFAPLFYLTLVIHFIDAYKKPVYRRIYFGAYLMTVSFVLLNALTPILVSGTHEVLQYRFWPTPGPAFIPFLIMFFGYVVFASLLLNNYYRKKDGLKKAQANYIFWGIGLAFLGGSTNYFLWLNIPIPPVLTILVSAYPVLIGYAIARYRLMDIHLVIKRSTSFLLSVFITLFVAVSLGLLVAYYVEVQLFILATFIAALAILIFEPIRNSVNSFANTYLFASVYNAQTVIENLASELTHTLHLNTICSLVMHAIVKSLKLESGELLTFDDTGYNVQSSINFPKHGKLTKSMYNFFRTQQDNCLADEVYANARSGSLMWKSIYTFFKKNGVTMYLPLIVEKKKIGALILGKKISGDSFYKDDVDLLSTLAKHTSIAVNNALLYNEISKFNRTLQKKVSEQTKDIREKNRKLKKLIDMRSEFLDIASHQLRTPITVINGLLEMYEQGLVAKLPKERQNRFFHDLQEKGRALRDIVNDILRASEFDTDSLDIKQRFHPVPLIPVVERIIKNLAPLAAQKKIKIFLEGNSDLPAVFSMDDYLAHVITNMVSNAIKYTEHGSVTISARKNGKKFVRLSVKDTGIGIPKNEIPKLFRKFQRASNAREMIPDGSGLGLFIVKKVVESHPGGKISVISTLGKGSVFSILLPVAK